MQDRIPLYPGRVKMTPVAGQANTFDMVRADDPTQPGTPLNKATLLKDATAALYGLGAGAVPDDVLAVLGKYKQYWWRRRLPAGDRFTEQKTSLTSSVSISGNNSSWTIKLAKSITINQSTGAVELSSPENYEMTNISYETAKALALKGPCYITNLKGATSDVYYIPANATTDTGAFTNNSTATLFYYEDSDGDTDFMILGGSKANPPGQKVTSDKTNAPAGDWEYVKSSYRNEYPDSIESNGYVVNVGNIISEKASIAANDARTPIKYADAVITSQTGTLSLVSPSELTVPGTTASKYDVLKGKYILLEDGANTGSTSGFLPIGVYYIPEDAIFSVGATSRRIVYVDKYAIVTASLLINGYEYEYLGIPLDNAVTAPKIEMGSYVGTGTYGPSNPNTLTFGFAPKLVIVFTKDYGLRPYGSSNGYWYHSFLWILGQDEILSASTGTNTLLASTNGSTFSWWYKSGVSSKQAENQLNKENTTYGYAAIG